MDGIWRGMAAALFLVMLATPPAWSIEVGQPLPGFEIRTFDGGRFSREMAAGRPGVLIFWNTWCDNCRKELPDVESLSRKVGGHGAWVLAVNTGINDSEKKARRYWRKQGFNFHSGFDHNFGMGEAFAVRGVPTVLLVDAGGIVRYKSSRLPGDAEERLKQMK